MKTIQTSVEIPEQLYKMACVLVKEGWFRDEKDIFSEAIRRFLESHRVELMEKYILDDVEWGLRGND
ncbi:MAG: CopG family transcriptional regulator [Candidatus Aminicenantes bacterium]|nr:CopG family transcriptional regulator [Candidatus Aminicenantes bacterium]NIM82506.1 CopG family transcriptional regulator [Candidatus Aminicenantes bacterium]NIN21864.1 CopG family transcriptional regulator [Candidatus Aminicenantes bacterium]NIN45642.1 CopG family transcriptional regulator [Candidatus Aminicenantes bacterium]NIN88475.1 CopG family transcriptional regulator [Candidatus Aminicenantes bacterium]